MSTKITEDVNKKSVSKRRIFKASLKYNSKIVKRANLRKMARDNTIKETLQQKNGNGILDAAMMEYKNIHERVLFNTQSCERNTIQMGLCIGVLLAFCINGYYNPSSALFVDLIMLFLIPIMSIGVILISLSSNVKIIALGEYLATIEKRINSIVGCDICENSSPEKKALNWEEWRLKYGYASDKLVFFDAAFLFIVSGIGALISPILRLFYINSLNGIHSAGYILFWLLLIPAIYILMGHFLLMMMRRMSVRTKRLKKIISDDSITYNEPFAPNKKISFNIICKLLLLYIFSLFVIFATCKFSFYDIGGKTALPSWIYERPIAHRGLHDIDNPENTLLAFEKAIKNGFAIEFDVMVTKDLVPIIFHDENAMRLCNLNANIADLTFVEVQQLLVNGKEPIPTLENALDFIDGRVPLLIEIKHNGIPGKTEQSIFSIIEKYRGAFAIQSFNPHVLNWVRRMYPSIIRGQLYGDWGWFSNPVIFNLRDNIFNAIAEPNFLVYDKNVVMYANLNDKRQSGLKVLGWIYNEHDKGSIAVDRYFDNIIIEK